jgi:hypothetical protein
MEKSKPKWQLKQVAVQNPLGVPQEQIKECVDNAVLLCPSSEEVWVHFFNHPQGPVIAVVCIPWEERAVCIVRETRAEVDYSIELVKGGLLDRGMKQEQMKIVMPSKGGKA